MKNNELHNKKLTEGFTTPNDYFDTFEDRLFDKLQAETVIPKEEGFKVPDAYFDSLEDTLTAQLFSAPTEETKVIPLANRRSYLKYISYAAAACIVFFIAAIMIQSPETEGSIFDDVANSEINTFIENDLIALNNYDVITAFEEENIDISSIFEVNLNETETIDYLENTGDSYDVLIE